MDKRWILIIIIAIVALGCGYLIVESSTSVGQAVTVIDKFAATVPEGFSVLESRNYDVTLEHDGGPEKMNIKSLGKNKKAKPIIKEFKKNMSSTYKILDNKTWKTPEGHKVYTIYYKNSTENLSRSYFYGYNYTFVATTTGYNNASEINKDVAYIADTLRPDYKQSQD
jgi:hypothetical protein